MNYSLITIIGGSGKASSLGNRGFQVQRTTGIAEFAPSELVFGPHTEGVEQLFLFRGHGGQTRHSPFIVFVPVDREPLQLPLILHCGGMAASAGPRSTRDFVGVDKGGILPMAVISSQNFL